MKTREHAIVEGKAQNLPLQNDQLACPFGANAGTHGGSMRTQEHANPSLLQDKGEIPEIDGSMKTSKHDKSPIHESDSEVSMAFLISMAQAAIASIDKSSTQDVTKMTLLMMDLLGVVQAWQPSESRDEAQELICDLLRELQEVAAASVNQRSKCPYPNKAPGKAKLGRKNGSNGKQ